MTQCYKKFTLILAGKSSEEQSNSRLSKRSSDGNSTWLCAEVCRFCKKGPIIWREESESSKKTEYERSTMIDKAMSLRKRLRTFLQNRAFKFNYQKLLVPLTL